MIAVEEVGGGLALDASRAEVGLEVSVFSGGTIAVLDVDASVAEVVEV